MLITHYFTIGNLSVPSSWIALIVAFVVAYSAVRVRYGKKQAGILADIFFYVVIVWKLSVLITDFSSVIRSPLSLIYFNGGVIGFYLGLVFVVGKVLVDMKKGRLNADELQSLFMGVVIVQGVFQLMMVVLNEGELLAQVVTVVVFSVFVMFFWMNSGKKGDWAIQLALLFIAVHVFVASFQPEGLIGTPLVVTILIGVFFALVFSWQRRTGVRSEELI